MIRDFCHEKAGFASLEHQKNNCTVKGKLNSQEKENAFIGLKFGFKSMETFFDDTMGTIEKEHFSVDTYFTMD